MVQYFAYGSNMNQEDLDRWCHEKGYPVIKFRSAQIATLENYKLVFNYYSKTKTRQSCVANIESHKGGHVVGVLFDMDENDLCKIDKKEGHPSCYKRHKINVKLEDSREVQDVLTYIVVDESERCKDGKPSKKYMDIIIEGAKQHGLSAEYIRKLESISTTDG